MSTTGGGEGEGRGGERGTRRESRAGGSCESERDGREAGTYISRVCPRPISGKSGDAPAPGALISPRLRSAFNPNCMRLSSRVHRPSTAVRVTGPDHAPCLNSPVGLQRRGAAQEALHTTSMPQCFAGTLLPRLPRKFLLHCNLRSFSQ